MNEETEALTFLEYGMPMFADSRTEAILQGWIDLPTSLYVLMGRFPVTAPAVLKQLLQANGDPLSGRSIAIRAEQAGPARAGELSAGRHYTEGTARVLRVLAHAKIIDEERPPAGRQFRGRARKVRLRSEMRTLVTEALTSFGTGSPLSAGPAVDRSAGAGQGLRDAVSRWDRIVVLENGELFNLQAEAIFLGLLRISEDLTIDSALRALSSFSRALDAPPSSPDVRPQMVACLSEQGLQRTAERLRCARSASVGDWLQLSPASDLSNGFIDSRMRAILTHDSVTLEPSEAVAARIKKKALDTILGGNLSPITRDGVDDRLREAIIRELLAPASDPGDASSVADDLEQLILLAGGYGLLKNADQIPGCLSRVHNELLRRVLAASRVRALGNRTEEQWNNSPISSRGEGRTAGQDSSRTPDNSSALVLALQLPGVSSSSAPGGLEALIKDTRTALQRIPNPQGPPRAHREGPGQGRRGGESPEQALEEARRLLREATDAAWVRKFRASGIAASRAHAKLLAIATASPYATEWCAILGEIQRQLAYARRHSGDYNGARRALRQAIRSFEQARKSRDHDSRIESELGNALLQLGEIDTQFQPGRRGVPALKRGISLSQRALDLEPDRADRLRNRAVGSLLLGEALLRRGEGPEAIKEAMFALDKLDKAATSSLGDEHRPGDSNLLMNRGRVESLLARAHCRAGRLDLADDASRESVAELDSALRIVAGRNAVIRRRLAHALIVRADVVGLMHGPFDEVGALLERAQGELAKARRMSEDEVDALCDYAILLVKRALLGASRPGIPRSAELMGKGLAALRKARKRDPLHPTLRPLRDWAGRASLPRTARNFICGPFTPVF